MAAREFVVLLPDTDLGQRGNRRACATRGGAGDRAPLRPAATHGQHRGRGADAERANSRRTCSEPPTAASTRQARRPQHDLRRQDVLMPRRDAGFRPSR